MSIVSTRAGIIIRLPVKFPAHVVAVSPIIVTQVGATYTFSFDFDALLGEILFPYRGAFPVASLPAGVEGDTARANNGRKIGEGPGVGTGVYVTYSAGFWRTFSTDAPVLA